MMYERSEDGPSPRTTSIPSGRSPRSRVIRLPNWGTTSTTPLMFDCSRPGADRSSRAISPVRVMISSIGSLPFSTPSRGAIRPSRVHGWSAPQRNVPVARSVNDLIATTTQASGVNTMRSVPRALNTAMPARARASRQVCSQATTVRSVLDSRAGSSLRTFTNMLINP